MSKTALIIVDLQNDYFQGGKDEILADINHNDKLHITTRY